jgi:uncharacterized damage-inducible protein DinB
MDHQLSTACGDGAGAPMYLQTLVAHLAWANRGLFTALREVESFDARPGSELIRRALDHVHVVSRIFQAHLQDVSHPYTSTQSATLPSLAELEHSSETVDRWYVETTASFDAAELARPRAVRFTDGNVVTMTAADMVLHVVTHTHHHRGNVDAIMYQTGMPRPRSGIPEFLVSRASAS